MNYEEFVRAFMDSIMNLSVSGTKVERHRVTKNNGVVREGLTVTGSNKSLMPMLYPDHYYGKYRRGVAIKHLACEALEELDEVESRHCIISEDFTEYPPVKDRILFQLINYDRNARTLQDQPYFRFLDLALVFYYYVDMGCSERATMRIANSILETWGIDKDELLSAALINTPNIEPPEFCPIEEIVNELTEDEGGADGAKDAGRDKTQVKPESAASSKKQKSFEYSDSGTASLTILTNKSRAYGAACMKYNGIFEDISEHYKASLFILPSSIHEVIVLPDSGSYTVEELEKMVSDINESEVAPSEILSNHVYRYDRMNKTIKL